MTDPKSSASSLFVQAPPRLANQYEADRFLRAWLRRKLPADVLSDIEPDVRQMGEISAGELYELQLNDRLREPELTQWDAWGNRVDRIELTPLWKRCAEIAAQRGLIAIPYASRHGRY